MRKADLILAVIDCSVPLEAEDRELLASLKGRKAIVILNKNDITRAVSEEEVRALSGGAACIFVSALYQSGLDEVRNELRRITARQDADAGRELFLTNLRHVDLVKKALEAVRRAQDSIAQQMPEDCIVVDLTEAWNLMGEITGDTVDNELINTIFDRFCVGK